MTRTFGPRPPRPEPAPRPPAPGRLVALAAVGLAAAGSIVLLRGPLRRATATATVVTGSGADGDEPAATDCPAVASPVPAPGGQVVEGDVSGDGCRVAGVYQAGALPGGARPWS